MASVKYFPYITYKDDNIHINNLSYITYLQTNNYQIEYFPYITYNSTFEKTENTYVLHVFNNKAQKFIDCKLYDTTEGFPLPTSYLTIRCNDKRKRFCPLNFVGREFDSGVRITDNFNNEFQICTNIQENIIKNYFPYGNLFIPLNNTNGENNLYSTLLAIFGKARVKLGTEEVTRYDNNMNEYKQQQEYILFYPPSALSSITKIFAIGLNIQFTTQRGITYSTYNNGLISTSYGKDRRLFAKSMMIKLKEQEPIKITYEDSLSKIRTTLRTNVTYPKTAPIKNAIILGSTIENLPNQSDSFEPLLTYPYWYMYQDNQLQLIDKNNNSQFQYFYNNYLNYPNSKFLYNYYDLDSSYY